MPSGAGQILCTGRRARGDPSNYDVGVVFISETKKKVRSKRRWEVAARLETVSRNRHETHVPSVLFTLVCSVLRYDSPPRSATRSNRS